MILHILMIAAVAIVVFGLSALLLVALLLRPQKEAQRALEVVLKRVSANQSVSGKERFLDGVLSIVKALRAQFGLNPSNKHTERLAAAGYWSSGAPDFYLAAQISIPIVCAWCGSLVHNNTLFWVFLCGTLGFFLPELWLTEVVKRRRNRLRRGLPDAIDLLVICVDAGLGLDQAVLRITEELVHSHPDLHEEFHRMRLEQKAGRPRLETWQNLALRTKLTEITSFVSLLIQSDRFGTQITKALSGFADDLRQRQRQRVEEAAAQTKIKIIFPLVFFIFPCLFIVLLGPAILNITHDLKSIVN